MSDAVKKLRFMAFDVDGVLTDGKLTYMADGSESKTFYTLDGAGVRMLQKPASPSAGLLAAHRPPLNTVPKTSASHTWRKA